MSLNLYNIQQNYRDIMSRIEEADGEISTEDYLALQITQEEVNVKSVQLAMVKKETDTEIETLEKEIARLTKKKKQRENNNDRLEELIKGAMVTFGVTEISGDTFKIKLSDSRAVNITDEGLIPKIYKSTKETVTISKKEIAAALKEGITVPGAEISKDKNLTIK